MENKETLSAQEIADKADEAFSCMADDFLSEIPKYFDFGGTFALNRKNGTVNFVFKGRRLGVSKKKELIQLLAQALSQL